jgi:hypothetical protein
MDKGADIEIVNVASKTAIDIAKTEGIQLILRNARELCSQGEKV